MKNLWLAALVLLVGGCAFEPDLSRFEPCDEEGQCPTGFLCLTEAQRCVPECGEDCPPEEDSGVDAGEDAGMDAGVDAGEDAGVDAGVDDAGVDAGVEDAGPELALAAITLAPAIETKEYSYTFMPTGGVPGSGYSFSMDGGVPGFTLTFLGELSSSAAPDAGTFAFSITVRDQASPVPAVVTTPFTLEVRPLLRVASPAALVEGRQGQVYFQRLFATGGSDAGSTSATLPYKWAIDGGLPPGLMLADLDGGVIQGTPSMQGTVSFGVTVSDSAIPPQQASRTVRIETKVLDTVFVIATRDAADGRVGTVYTQPLKAYGGLPPYTWSVVSGTPPPGVGLVGAELSGTPTAAGRFSFTVRGADSLTNQTQDLTITVY